MKKVLSLGLSLMIIVSVFSTGIKLSADAETDYYDEDGIYYKLNDDDETAVLIGCDPEEVIDDLNISSTLENGYIITSIGDMAFQGRRDIKNVYINDQIEYIGDYAFESCSKLKSVEISGGVKNIGVGAFSSCGSLNSVVLDKDVSSIDNGAFFMDKSLRAFNFPKNLKSVGEYAFAFSGLSTVVMNNKITAIPDRTFYNCELLQRVVLPKNLESIGNYAFTTCRNLDIDELPSTLDKIGVSAFEGCALSEIHFNGSEIGSCAFSDNREEIETVTFSDNLKKVGSLLFAGSDVDTLELPDNISYENGAFAGVYVETCKLLESNDKYILDDGVIFTKDKKTLVYYPIKEYLTPQEKKESTPDEDDFDKLYDDEQGEFVYKIPNGVEEISPYAFTRMGNVTEVVMPDSLKKIGAHAFERARSLRKITIPDGVKEIKEYTYADLGSATELNLGSVEKIDNYAFAGFNYDITDVKLPASLKTFNPSAFFRANFKFKADGNFKAAGGALYTADSKTLLYYPPTDKETVKLPDGLETIASLAFSSNYVTKEIYIPDSLKKLEDQAVEYESSYNLGSDSISFREGVCLIGNASESVKEYADNHNIGVFTAKPSQNIETVTLEGNETAQFKINGAEQNDIVYTSGDSKIASVSEDGTITGLSKGKTFVTAASGTTYFKCEVTVKSESGVEYKGFDESKYLEVTPEDIQDKIQMFKEDGCELFK